MIFDPKNIKLLPLNSLLTHEDVVEENVEKLKREILFDGFQKDPIIVEKDTFVVLDGAHRIRALQSVGIDYVACYLVPYSLEGIKVERWARAISYSRKEIKHLLEALELRSVSIEKAYELTDRSGVAFFSESESYVKDFASSLEAYLFLRRVEKVVNSMRWKVDYIPEDEVDIEMGSGRFIVLGPRLKKADVVGFARKGMLLPPKTTHHIINPRPVSIRCPLEKLRTGDLELITLIKNLKVIPPESVYEGRKYKESLVVLNE